MRTTWVAIAIIALAVLVAVLVAVGLAAGHRIDRPWATPQGSMRADRSVEVTPNPTVSAGETPPSRPAAPGVPESPSSNDTPSARSTGTETPGASRGAASSPPVPAAVIGAPSAPASLHGAATSSPTAAAVARPLAPPVAPPTAPTNATTEQEHGKQPGTPESEALDDPESDRHPAVLQYLRFDPAEIQNGGTTILSVGSTDDLSGIKLVFGSLRSPSGAGMVAFSARDATGSGVFSTTVAIPAQGETGDWFVANLRIVDKADNTLSLVFGRATVPEGGVLRVLSQDSDSTAPTVHRVSIVKDSVGAGEKNRIVIDVDDDRSGVASVTGAFQSPSKSAFIPFGCAPGGDPASWEGDVAIPANADCGEWTLRQLRVADKANNIAFLSTDAPQIGRVSFVVSGGGECDSDPPMIDHMEFSPSLVSNEAATEVTLTVRAHDDLSGLGSVSGWIDGPVAANGQAPRIHFECVPDSRDPDGPMTGRVTVPRFAGKGVWRVTLAQIIDKARNMRAYNGRDPALREANFTVE